MPLSRLNYPGQPVRLVVDDPDPDEHLTERQRQIVQAVRARNGNRSSAARDLGISVQSVQIALRDAARTGPVRVPPATAGRRGRSDLRPRPPRARVDTNCECYGVGCEWCWVGWDRVD